MLITQKTVLKIASAFGRTLNHGWDLTGPARGSICGGNGLRPAPPAWTGTAEVTDAQLEAAGLNQPVQLQKRGWNGTMAIRAAQIDKR